MGATFGPAPLGSQIVSKVYYADNDLCDPNNPDVNRGGYPTRPADENGEMMRWTSPFVLMVDRGGCSFVDKTRQAQLLGAEAVLFADHVCLCSETLKCSAKPTDTCEVQEPTLADDGTGSDISIPAVLMGKVDADKVKTILREDGLVEVDLSWPLPDSESDVVEYALYTSPADQVANDFLLSFSNVATSLEGKAHFVPHMYIMEAIKSGCIGEQCKKFCTNAGRYCAPDPDGHDEEGISGADVVRESLRRQCIWLHYGEEEHEALRWWEYVRYFAEECWDPDQFANLDCISDVYDLSEVNGNLIEMCMKESGDPNDDVENDILEGMLADLTGIDIVPALEINGMVLRGALTPEGAFSSICAAIPDGSKPAICTRCDGETDPMSCIGVASTIAEPIDEPAETLGDDPDNGMVENHDPIVSMVQSTIEDKEEVKQEISMNGMEQVPKDVAPATKVETTAAKTNAKGKMMGMKGMKGMMGMMMGGKKTGKKASIKNAASPSTKPGLRGQTVAAKDVAGASPSLVSFPDTDENPEPQQEGEGGEEEGEGEEGEEQLDEGDTFDEFDSGTPFDENPGSAMFGSEFESGAPWGENPGSAMFGSEFESGTPWGENPDAGALGSEFDNTGGSWEEDPDAGMFGSEFGDTEEPEDGGLGMHNDGTESNAVKAGGLMAVFAIELLESTGSQMTGDGDGDRRLLAVE